MPRIVAPVMNPMRRDFEGGKDDMVVVVVMVRRGRMGWRIVRMDDRRREIRGGIIN